jgi:hypothetical protein
VSVSMLLVMHAHVLAIACVCTPTLVPSTLACGPRVDSKLVLTVIAKSAECDLLACFLLHRRQQCRVVHRLVRTIRGEDRCTHVIMTADLRRCECAWSARATLVLQ